MTTQYAKKLKDGARQYKVEPLLPNKPRGFRDNPIKKSMGTLDGFGKDTSVSKVQVDALRTLYYAQPAIQSCRSVLVGELMGSGFELMRNGKRVDLTAEFRAHLQEHWIPFAQSVIDCFLVAGFCVVDYEKTDIDVGGKRKKGGAVVPVCAPLDTYQLHYHYRDSKYRRTYMCYPTNNYGNTNPDEEVDIHIRTPPDAHGNCVSPVATCYDLGSTQMAMVELALKAESLRTKAMIISQPAPTKAQDDPLGSASMFFDSESRAIQAGLDQDSNASAANALSLQVQMCQVINRLQNRGEEAERAEHRAHKLGMGDTSFVPPTQKPELCTLPKEQVGAASGYIQAEARSDLVPISQHAISNFCSAMGVPSGLIFESRFVGNQSSHLRLLNTTVEQLAQSIERVLSLAYRRVYGRGAEGGAESLRLAISPMAAIADITALTTAGVADAKSVQRLALRSIGLGTEDIEEAAGRLDKQTEETHKLAVIAAQKAAQEVAAKAAADQEQEKARVGQPKASAAGGSSSKK